MKDCCDRPQITHAAGTTAKEATQARSGESVTALIQSAPASSSSSDDEATASGGPLAAVGRSARSMGDDCCSMKESEIAALGAHADIKRVLQIVLVINLVMFVAEFTAGVLASSTSLMADSVDMLGDALVYILSLYALQRGLRWRAGAALAKGAIIAAFGVGVFVDVVLKLFHGVIPIAGTMLLFGFIALGANLCCLALLYRYRDRDVNLSSTFECSRNDVIANTGVLIAAGGVYAFDAGWPDLVVGALIAILFFRSAIRVLRQAWPQFRSAEPTVAVALD
jgi:Co/Zn/Cd efflux system component